MKFIERHLYKLLLLLTILPTIVYVFCFWDSNISKKTSDWGDFGSYIGGCCSVLTAIAAVIISCKLNYINNKENRIVRCVEGIIMSFDKIRNLHQEIERNPNNLDVVQRCRRWIKTECLTMDYYVKTFPVNTLDLYNFRKAIHDVYINATDNNKWNNMQYQYDEFIKGLPINKF